MTGETKGVEDRETLTGKATGAMVMALFGLLWVLGCAGALAGALVPILLASGVAVTAILVAASLRLWRVAAGRPSGGWAGTSASHRVRRRFRLIGIVEGLGIGVVVFACARLGRPEFIPALVALVVGLHFFPLASLFRVSLYHATGAGLCLVAVVTPLVASPLGAQTVAWQVVPGLGAAVTLWATSAVLVVGGIGSIRRGI